MRSSRLVAESLRVIPVHVADHLASARAMSGVAMQCAWYAAGQPSRCSDPPPTWLRPPQRLAWRRAVAAIEGWHGAVLAEPVGSGKSWVALAVAQRFARVPLVIGPAALALQWRETATQAGIPIHWHSHERLSRGVLPPDRSTCVIVDEAHRFRHLHTSRTQTLAPWLVGRRVLFLTATPIVNRRGDLLALLQLWLPDDALTLDGIHSLRQLENAERPPAALRRVVVRTAMSRGEIPIRQETLIADAGEQQRGRAACRAVRRMTLGDDPGVQRLLSTVLLDAAASSDAAWRAALRRYRALLLQSRDAGGLSRAALRHFAGPALDQLVLWPLLGDMDSHGAPPQQDLPVVEELLATPPPAESWMTLVAQELSDGRPTICFTRHRATALALVRHLGDRTAWATGTTAGIGPHRLPREQVLSAFGPRRAEWRVMSHCPASLVCTEVLSEGLDLQGASRVIHLDLPWHPARLAQRNGRVHRLGQLAPNVAVMIRRPAPALERVLGLGRRIQHKSRIAETWLEELMLADAPEVAPSPGIWCAVGDTSSPIEAAALVSLTAGARSGAVPLELREGIWRPGPATLPPFEPVPHEQVSAAERGRCTRLARRAVWRALALTRADGVGRPRLVARLLLLARDARMRRDTSALERIDRLLAVATRAVPLGLEQQLASLADAPDRELLAASVPGQLEHLRPIPITVLLVLFRPQETSLR